MFKRQSLRDAYFQDVTDVFNQTIGYQHLPAINIRRMRREKNDGEKTRYDWLKKNGELIPFKSGEVIHWKNYDPQQDIYGIPEYLAGLQSILLNENATLFRRRYYENGNHAGFILYTRITG